MLCESMFRLFHFYFSSAYSLGFFPFRWNNKDHYFEKAGSSSPRQLILWKLNTFILFIKVVFLGIQVYNLSGDLSKLVFQNLFFISYLIAVLHNLIFWRTRKSFPVLYWRCVTFCRRTHAAYLRSATKRQYPLQKDGLEGMMKGATCIVIIFTLSMLLMSLENPRAPPFFVNWIDSEQTFINSYFVRFPVSLFEAYITAFGWATNISLIFLIPNFCILFKFWCWELCSNAPSGQLSRTGSKLREVETTIQTYRQLQLLMTQFNECFSGHIQELFMLAFINQVSVNYGTLKLYKELPLHVWIACPYLSASGAFNLCTLHNFMGMTYETSKAAIETWKAPNSFVKVNGENQDRRGVLKKYDRLLYESCPPLKAKYGSLKFVTKDQGIQWVDSLIDTTVTLLLWQ